MHRKWKKLCVSTESVSAVLVLYPPIFETWLENCTFVWVCGTGALHGILTVFGTRSDSMENQLYLYSWEPRKCLLKAQVDDLEVLGILNFCGYFVGSIPGQLVNKEAVFYVQCGFWMNSFSSSSRRFRQTFVKWRGLLQQWQFPGGPICPMRRLLRQIPRKCPPLASVEFMPRPFPYHRVP